MSPIITLQMQITAKTDKLGAYSVIMTKLIQEFTSLPATIMPITYKLPLFQLRDLLLGHLPVTLQQAQRRPLDRSNLDNFGVPPNHVTDAQIDSRQRIQGLLFFRFGHLDGIFVDFLLRELFRRGLPRVDYRVGFGVDAGLCGALPVVGCYRADLLSSVTSTRVASGELMERRLRDRYHQQREHCS